MDLIAQLTSENGLFALVGALIGYVLNKLLTMSKIRKTNAERNKLLAQTEELKEKMARERAALKEQNTAQFTAYVKIIPATKTGNPAPNQTERLHDGSFFTASVPVTNIGDKRIIMEEVRFIGQEQFVDNGYGADKLKLEKIDKQILAGKEVPIEPGKTEKFSFDYGIGKRFNDRLGVDVVVKARVGNHPSTEKKISEPLEYIY